MLNKGLGDARDTAPTCPLLLVVVGVAVMQ
jgi:hypothetical protein